MANDRDDSRPAPTGRVAGKVALVTGAARGQGRSHCVRLAEEGADIIAVDLCGPVDGITSVPPSTVEDLEQTAAEVDKLGRRILIRQVDVRDLAGMQAVVRDGIAELGRLDIVVANAGVVEWGPSWEVSEVAWRAVVDTNLTGVWITARATVPSLIEAGHGGSLIFTSSLAGTKGLGNVAPYTSTKHGIVGLMRAMAIELGPHHIRVNTVNPTNVDTPMIHHPTLWGYFAAEGEEPVPEMATAGMASLNAIPVPYVDPVDVSNAVLFLASDEARYVTGAMLPVDAGAGAK